MLRVYSIWALLEAGNGVAPGFPPTRAPSGLTLFRSGRSFIEDLPETGRSAYFTIPFSKFSYESVTASQE